MNEVVFNAFDLAHINLFAERQRCIKRHLGVPSRKYDKSRTELEIHYIGAMGEWAVKKAFPEAKLDFETYQVRDKGTDLMLWDHRIQVKTSFQPNIIPHLYFNNLSEFLAPFAICVRVVSPVRATVLGCISRQRFEREATIEDFGYGERLAVKPQKLSPVEVLKDWEEE